MSTYPASTVPAVKAWLLGQLTTAATAASGLTIGVFYNEAGSNLPSDLILVGTGERTVETGNIVGDMGAFSMRETYEIPVTVSAYRAEGMQAAEERAWALLAIVELLVRQTMFGIIAAQTATATWGGNVWNLSIGRHTVVPTWATAGDGDGGEVVTGAIVEITYPIIITAEL